MQADWVHGCESLREFKKKLEILMAVVLDVTAGLTKVLELPLWIKKKWIVRHASFRETMTYVTITNPILKFMFS